MLQIKTKEFSLKINPKEFRIIELIPSFMAEIECVINHFSGNFSYSGIDSKINISSFDRFIESIQKLKNGEEIKAILHLGVYVKYVIDIDLNNIEYPVTNHIIIREFRNIQEETILECKCKTGSDFLNYLGQQLRDFKHEYEEQIKMILN